MTRAQAVEKARKLEALARRTRHAGERGAAREALLRVASRHGLRPEEWREREPSEPKRAWQAPARGPAEAWYFDPRSGAASANVKVHAYKDRANWRIEVPPDLPYGGFGRERVEQVRRRDPRLNPRGR